MQKNVLLGIAAFGGLVVVGMLLADTPGDEVGSEEVVAATELAVPADLPAIPIYPNTTLTNVRDTDGESARDVSLSLGAEASIAEVNEWYREAFAAQGWTIKSDKNVAGYQIIQAEKDNLYTSFQTANGGAAGQVVISQHIKVRK